MKKPQKYVVDGENSAYHVSHAKPFRMKSRPTTRKIPAAIPTPAPLASTTAFWLISALASSISSWMRICARSVISWIAWPIFVSSPCAASWRARISSVLMAMSVAPETLEDDRRDEPAGERGADEDLRPVGRDAEREACSRPPPCPAGGSGSSG